MYHVHLIDTPGFDDTSRSDIDTLKTISTYLGGSFANGVRISGVIYLHRISDNRLGGSSLRNLRMFKKLSGARTWAHTVIGTTMWEAGQQQHEQGEWREKELTSNYDYFGDMLSEGAKVFRIAEHGTGADDQRQSALQIVSYLIRTKKSWLGVELEIQRELVLEAKTLTETLAGKEALGDLYHLQCQLARQLQDAQKDMREALESRDVEHARQVRALQEECQRKMTETRAQEGKLRTSLLDMHDAEVENLQCKLHGMELQHRAVLVKKRQELEDMEESLRHVREQSAVDAARWRKQCLDIAALQKQRANENLHRECEQSLATMTQKVAQQEAQLRTVVKAKDAVQTNVVSRRAKGIVRSNIAGGIAQGIAGATATAIGTAGKTPSCMVYILLPEH